MATNEHLKSQWQEFCFDLIEAKKSDCLENAYQDKIEIGLRQLGWSRIRGEICPKERINVGSSNQLEPDLTIKIDSNSVFVIEIKRPNNKITKRQEEQLLSYMRLRQNAIGLYIGDEIRLYYDHGEKLPFVAWRTEISLSSKEGWQFIDFFSRETFNINRIIKFCIEKYNENYTNTIMSTFKQGLENNQDTTIRQALTEYFVEYKKCNKELVQTLMDSIQFSSTSRPISDSIIDTAPHAQPSSNGIVIVQGANTNSQKKDRTKYSLDGGGTYYGKGKFVREVVAYFLKQNPNLTYSQVIQIFPDELQGSYGVMRTIDEIELSTHNKKDLSNRYDISKPLKTKDGISFVVCTQWGAYNFGNILNLIKKWGWNVLND